MLEKIMTEKKSVLPSLKNLDCKRLKLEADKGKKLFKNIPIDITEMNDSNYAGAKVVNDKLRSPQRNPNRKREIKSG